MSLPEPQPNWALFLDFDGTLVDIAPAPGAIRPDPRLAAVLAAASASVGGALAILSGRPISQIDHYLAPLVLPVAGLHGMEWRAADGGIRRHPGANDDIARIRGQLAAFVDRHPGLVLEDKGSALALHYRQAPALALRCREVVERAVAGSDELMLLPGKMVLEVKSRDRNKGVAIQCLMRYPPFRERIPVCAGDDLTDEDGFAVVNALAGVSIRIGADQPTQARFHIPDVAGFLVWLQSFPRCVQARTV